MSEETIPTWCPVASFEVLRLRAALVKQAREFFALSDVLEVETPVLSQAASTDCQLESLVSRFTGPGFPTLDLYLHTSPEFAMKRLLAAGSGPIYQFCKVFRQGEAGRRHHPEFTLLEWYRPGYDHHALMEEVDSLLRRLLTPHMALAATETQSYRDVCRDYAGVDPMTASAAEIQKCLEEHGSPVMGVGLDERDAWLDLLMTHIVEPALPSGRPFFIYDYPASQAALARVRKADPPVAERFELYINGMELANGFHELADASEQRRRFNADLICRRRSGKLMLPIDEHLLAALEQGLPDCAGVAMGWDRLVMLAAGVENINQVLAFPLARA